MRVVQLIAGAGGMYCGSCMRDNRLAAALARQGRDVLLVPLYTPIRTDEQDVSIARVYYGGINVYLRHKSSLFGRLPGFVNRMLSTPALLRGVGRLAGATRPEHLGALTVSVLLGPSGSQRKELDELISALRCMQPDLIHLPNLMFAGIAKSLKDALGVPIVCSLAGEDVFLDALTQPHRARAFELIAQGAMHIDGFVAPSTYYGTYAARHFRLPSDRVHLVPMGIRLPDDKASSASREAPHSDAPFTIGYLARICPEKGFHVLCEAFVKLRRMGRACRLAAAGYLGSADRRYYRDTVNMLAKEGGAAFFDFAGEVTRRGKFAFLYPLNVFSVPTVYHEAKGFYVLEALGCGVPVVQPRHGAFPELLEATGGGLLYDPDDPDGLVTTIMQLMDDQALRERLARTGRDAVCASYTDELMARRTWSYYEQVVGGAKDTENAPC